MQHAPQFARTPAQIGATLKPFLPLLGVLLLTLIGMLLARRTPPALRVAVGGEGDAPYIAGMYLSERGDDDATFRWTTPLAQLRAPGSAFDPAMLRLRAYGEAGTPARPLTLQRDQQPINVMALAQGWRDYQLLVPAPGGLAAWDDPPLVLRIAPLPRVADDGRDKGFPLARFELLPLAGAFIPWALLPSIALLGVAGALCWRVDQRAGLSAAGRGWRVAALIALPALGLVAWAARSPYGFAYLLPALPWTVGLLTLALLVTARRPAAASASRGAGVLAVTLMLVGVVLLAWPQMLALGGGLAALGALLFAQFDAGDDVAPGPHIGARAAAVALAAIVVLALGLRLYRIAELPYGLWRDEGRHGLEALHMLHDPAYRPAYIESIDLPGLGILPFSWALAFWGIQPWTLRSVTALAGALTVVPLYGLTALLTRSRATGLLAALLLAASHWSIALSRFSFPTVFDPLLQLTALWLLLYALTRPQLRLAYRAAVLLAAGACFGLAAQTYHTGRAGLLVGAAFALSYWLGRRERRRDAPLVLMVCAGFMLTAFPLLGYALENPARFSSRLGSVSLLGEQEGDWHSTLGKLDRSLGAHVMMWWARGDQNGRHVAPGRPMLDPLTGLGLLVGLVVLLRGLGDWRKRCLLLGLVLGLLPSALAVEYPHAMRSIDALGFGCAVAALGLFTAARALAVSSPRRFAALAGLAFCGVVLAFNAWMYFVAMPPDRAVWTAVYPYHTQVAAYLRRLADAGDERAVSQLYVPAGLSGNAVYDFLAGGLAPRTYEPATPEGAPAGSRFVVLGSLGQADVERVLQLQQLDPASGEPGPALPDGSKPAFVVYRVIEP